MGLNLVQIPDHAMKMRHVHGFHEDFDHIVTGDRWTVTASNSGSAVGTDAVGGVLAINPSDGTVANNDETYVHQTWETFKFAAGKPLVAEALIKFVEGNTDDANIIFGLKDAWAADSILDDGGGPAASYSGAVFFKVDGGTLWNVEHSLSTTQNTVQLTAANSLDGVAKTAGGAAYQRLRIEANPLQSGVMDLAFYIDDILVAKFKDLSYASATEMEVGFGIKNGADTTVEQLLVDYCYAYQTR